MPFNDLDLDFYSKEPVKLEDLRLEHFTEETSDEQFEKIMESIDKEIEAITSAVVENVLDKVFETIEGDSLIEEMIEELGLLDEEAPLAEASYSNPLPKAGGVNNVNLSYQSKLKRAETQAAMILAKEANDILYTRYKTFNAKRVALKKQIILKYNARAKIRARESIDRARRKKETRLNKPHTPPSTTGIKSVNR